jgi:hypothetical protein
VFFHRVAPIAARIWLWKVVQEEYRSRIHEEPCNIKMRECKIAR